MNFMHLRLEKQADNSGDWLIFGDIVDDRGNVLATFGENGTSVNQWWVRQDAMFQENYILRFISVMAEQIVNGTAE